MFTNSKVTWRNYILEDIKRIKELTALLNHHRDTYYNGSKPEISDYEYDKKEVV